MSDVLTVASGTVGILGAAAGILGADAAIRSSSARRYAERGIDAATLLEALDKTDDSKFVTTGSNARLRLELSRVV